MVMIAVSSSIAIIAGIILAPGIGNVIWRMGDDCISIADFRVEVMGVIVAMEADGVTECRGGEKQKKQHPPYLHIVMSFPGKREVAPEVAETYGIFFEEAAIVKYHNTNGNYYGTKRPLTVHGSGIYWRYRQQSCRNGTFHTNPIGIPFRRFQGG